MPGARCRSWKTVDFELFLRLRRDNVSGSSRISRANFSQYTVLFAGLGRQYTSGALSFVACGDYFMADASWLFYKYNLFVRLRDSGTPCTWFVVSGARRRSWKTVAFRRSTTSFDVNILNEFHKFSTTKYVHSLIRKILYYLLRGDDCMIFPDFTERNLDTITLWSQVRILRALRYLTYRFVLQ